MILCGMDAVFCPHDKNICCYHCDTRDCGYVCGEVNHEGCRYATTNEVTAFQSSVPDAIRQITDIIIQQKKLDEQSKKLKTALREAMEKYGVKKWENDQISMTYVAPTTKTTIDSAKLKKERPDIAEQYSKTSNVSASVRVTVK